MSLTGLPGGPPAWPSGDVTRSLGDACLALAELARKNGGRAEISPADLLCRRAAWRGLSAGGRVSAGGQCRLLRASDGWVAVSLTRPSDYDAVPALVAGDDTVAGQEDVWTVVARWVAHTSAVDASARAQLLGIPAAPLRARPGCPRAPWVVQRLGPLRQVQKRRPLVVDLSAMWAGPLCAHLLGLAGAEVVKVEDPARPDAARLGDPQLFELLHRGHDQVAIEFATPEGVAELRQLLGSADVVIEGSRPRALAALGIDPATFLSAQPGRTWVSITGYGREGPRSNDVAFGDDAAVAGGLVAWTEGSPVFCGDAIADPITGLYAAVAALGSITDGGGHLIDCAMARAAAFAHALRGCPREHRCVRSGDGWAVMHPGDQQQVAVQRPVAGQAETVGSEA